MARTFYRIVGSDPPSREDFVSNAAKGRRPPSGLTPTQHRQWDGLSVFETEAQARRQVRARPSLGRYIAELRISDDAAVAVERTNLRSAGHHTIWGSAEEILVAVTRIVPVQREERDS